MNCLVGGKILNSVANIVLLLNYGLQPLKIFELVIGYPLSSKLCRHPFYSGKCFVEFGYFT